MEKPKNPKTLDSKNKQDPTSTEESNQNLPDEQQNSNQTSKINASNQQKTTETAAAPLDLDDFIPRKDVEFAFSCLTNWESSYDGVHRVWELIKNEPDINIDDYFDSLDFTQKCFLISGLYANMEEDKMDGFAPIIDRLDQRITNETKSDRVQREAQRIGEKMSELIKTETPKINRIRESSSSTIRSSPSSISSKVSTTPRDIRPSQSLYNDSSVSSKSQVKSSNFRTNTNSNASTSSRLSKTPVIKKSESTAPTSAFGFSVKRTAKTKTSTPSHADDASVNSNYTYGQSTNLKYSGSNYQNSVTPGSRLRKTAQDNSSTSTGSSLYSKTPNSNLTKSHRSKL